MQTCTKANINTDINLIKLLVSLPLTFSFWCSPWASEIRFQWHINSKCFSRHINPSLNVHDEHYQLNWSQLEKGMSNNYHITFIHHGIKFIPQNSGWLNSISGFCLFKLYLIDILRPKMINSFELHFYYTNKRKKWCLTYFYTRWLWLSGCCFSRE